MSTNYYAIVAPCACCGQSLARPVHFGKDSASHFILHTGGYHDDADDAVYLDSRKRWQGFLRRPYVVLRDEYRVPVTPDRLAALWRRRPMECRGWFR